MLGRRYKLADLADFENDIRNLDTTHIFDSDDPNVIWTIIFSHIMRVVDKHFPVQTIRVANSRPFYLDDGIIKLMHQRDIAYCHARRDQTTQAWAVARQFRARVAKEIRSACRKFVCSQLELANGDSQKFWQVINNAFFKSNTKSIKEIMDIDTGIVHTGKAAADTVNHYFCQISKKLATKFCGKPTFDSNNTRETASSRPIIVGYRHVSDLIKKIDCSKSSCFESLPTKLLKVALTELLEVFTDFLNLCFHNAVFLEEWNSATVVCIPKKGTLLNPDNLRPISLLPIPGKIMEIIINEEIMAYLESNNLLADAQMGFRKGRSTIDGRFGLVDEIYRANNASHYLVAVFVDLTKAFNTVNHHILLRKMESMGFSGKMLSLMKSYLANRRQKTIIDGVYSDTEPIVDGVPQGSVLGPTLFLCYNNDVVQTGLESGVGLYADDTVLYMTGASLPDLEKRMNDTLVRYTTWTTLNRLTINSKKTKFMVFTGSRNPLPRQIDLRIGATQLEYCDTYEYLGLTLDSGLTFEHHIGKLIASCNHRLFTLSKICKYLDEKSAINIYKSLIMSKLNHCCIFYGDAKKTVTDRIQRMQNRALRICTLASRYTSNLNLHIKCKVLPLNLRRKLDMCSLMFRQMKKNEPGELSAIKRPNTRFYFTTLNNLPTPRSDRFLKSIAYTGPNLWASLPKEVRVLNDLEKFKVEIRRMVNLEFSELSRI